MRSVPSNQRSNLALAAGTKVEGRRGPRTEDESGSSLILALVFIVAIGLIVTALTSWAMNDLNNTTKFNSASSLDYAATSVTEVAIQSIRYTPQMPQTASPNLASCWTLSSGYVSELTLNGHTVAVWCSTLQNLGSPQTRVVTFYACQTTLTSGSSSGAVLAGGVACQTKPLLTARVAFDDYPPGGSAPLKVTCTTWCGQGAVTQDWTWGG